MLYLQLFSLKLSGALGEHLGSDGVIPLDGRMTYRTALEWASNQTFKEEIKAYQLRSTADHRYSNYRNVSEVIDATKSLS